MIDIKDKFLELTSKTYPHGKEDELIPFLPDNLQRDIHGNFYIRIGETSTMFTSHLDTATQADTNIVHVFDEDMIRTDKKSILGADDKAGVVVMLYMIERNIPGLYYFFLGEEVGCVGSKKLAESEKTELNMLKGINRCVSFDRRGYNSVITYQMSKRCCSEDFAKELSARLNTNGMEMKPDPTGVCTDSIQFISLISECTNISVGYFREHTYDEHINIVHLDKLAKASVAIDWETLPTARDKSKVEYDYGWDDYYGGHSRRGNSWNSSSNSTWNSGRSQQYQLQLPMGPTQHGTTTDKVEEKWSYDAKFDSVIKYTIKNSRLVTIELCKERIEYETYIIRELLEIFEIQHNGFQWDGWNLNVVDVDWTHKTLDRNEIEQFASELSLHSIEGK
jgi:hypothetical protein